MQSVTFNFRDGVSPETQAKILDKVSNWEEVKQAGHLKPHAKNKALLRFCYVYLSDTVDPNRVVKLLDKIPEIEAIAVPTQRYLV